MGSYLSTSGTGSNKCPMHQTKGIDHIVLLKTKPDATSEQIKSLINGVNSLSTIDGVLSVSIGRVFVEQDWMDDRTGGVTYALRVRLRDKDALHRYQDDEGHKKIIRDAVAPIITEKPVAVDFESHLVMG
mmetsp:Transcript_866/g.1829  ORF Transcript_866/g.1829 Transcript_866/m.1829 type:complete len:130 (+) Transcript_866:147-536(+)